MVFNVMREWSVQTKMMTSLLASFKKWSKSLFEFLLLDWHFHSKILFILTSSSLYFCMLSLFLMTFHFLFDLIYLKRFKLFRFFFQEFLRSVVIESYLAVRHHLVADGILMNLNNHVEWIQREINRYPF